MGFEGVPFPAGGFQVEDQVFHIQPQLAEGFLDEIEDSAAAASAVDDAEHERLNPRALLRGKGVLHFGGDPDHRYVFHLAGRRWTLEPDHGWRGEPARSRVVLIGPYGSFDPALLDMTIAQCALGRPSPTSSASA